MSCVPVGFRKNHGNSPASRPTSNGSWRRNWTSRTHGISAGTGPARSNWRGGSIKPGSCTKGWMPKGLLCVVPQRKWISGGPSPAQPPPAPEPIWWLRRRTLNMQTMRRGVHFRQRDHGRGDGALDGCDGPTPSSVLITLSSRGGPCRRGAQLPHVVDRFLSCHPSVPAHVKSLKPLPAPAGEGTPS